MNQSTLLVLLGSAVALLLVLCGVLLGLYIKKSARPTSSTLNLSPNTTPAEVQRDSKNDRYISATREELKEIESVIIPRLTMELTAVIPLLREQLSDRLKQGNEGNFLEIYAYAISFAKGADIRTETERRCGLTMEAIFDVYQEKLLPSIFEAVPDAVSLESRYALTQDVRTREALNGQAALKRNLSPVYSELEELARLQQRLASYLPQLEEMKSRGTDWGSAARSFAGGALACAHPLLGVPFIIANWFGDSEKQKKAEALVKTAMNEFADYIGRWERFPNIYLPICEEQRVYIEEKVKGIFEKTVPRILADLDNAGFSLEKVPKAFSRMRRDIQQDLEEIRND